MPRRKPGERWECEACGEPLVGAASTSSDSTLPVQVAPVENGNVLLQQKDGTLTGFVFGNAVVRGALQDAGVVMRVNHFSNCPGRERFERR